MSTSPIPAGGDGNRAGELDAVAWTWAAVASIFVALRVYSRLYITHNIWWDDHVIVLSTLLMIAFTILWTVLGAKSGCRHLFYLTPQQAMSASRLNWITQPVAIMALALGKVSVALLILRIMGKSFWRRIFLYFSMISAILFCGLAIIFTFAQCRPVQALWNPALVQMGKAKCWKPQTQSNFSIFVGSMYIPAVRPADLFETTVARLISDRAAGWLAFLDVALATVAISVIIRLQLPATKKILLSSLLGLGIFAAVCACIKTSLIPSIDARSDITWETVTLWIWNANGCGVVIIAACIPTLRPLCLIVFRRPGRQAYTGSKESRTYVQGGSKRGYLRSGSQERERGGIYDSTSVIRNVDAQENEASWLEMGNMSSESGDIRQVIDVRVERTDRKADDTADPLGAKTGSVIEMKDNKADN
ncbi:MAG: hypothetical protein Q9191_000761 [Dirinaria sp. TL-2023a]